MKIVMTSVPVGDQEKAPRFYTEKLGFVKRHSIHIVCRKGREGGIRPSALGRSRVHAAAGRDGAGYHRGAG